MKKQKIRTIQRRLDKLWSQIIRSKGECEVCGKQNDECQLHGHHYYGRRSKSTRWDLPNGFCLCALHHTLGIQSAHESPEWFRTEVLRIRGKQWLNDLRKKFNKPKKWTIDELLELEIKLKEYESNYKRVRSKNNRDSLPF